MLSIKAEDENKLHPDALRWFNAQRADIQRKVPLEELSDNDLDTFLSDDEKSEFIRYMNEITRGLAGCINTDGASPDPFVNAKVGLTVLKFELNSWIPMDNIGLLLRKVYERKVAKAKEEQRKREEEEKRKAEEAREEERKQQEMAEAERRKEEYDEKWEAAFLALNPPLDDAKVYLGDEEYREFRQALWETIEVYLKKGEGDIYDLQTFDYWWYLEKITKRKTQEAQKNRAISEAKQYNAYLNQEISRLRSKLEPKQKDLLSYFKLKIKDKRYNSHNFDYVLSKEEEGNFDRTLVTIANEKLKQLIPDSLRQFIDIPPQYYRIYFPLPSLSYSGDPIPCLYFCFDIFVAAYGEVWLKPGKKSFGGYEFDLPNIEEKNYSVVLQEPKFLGYYYLVLKPEELGGYSFWQSIPLILLKGLLSGETKPNGITISAASDGSITYKVQKFKEEVDIPDKFADYLKNIGSIDEMVSMGIMTEKVASIAKSELGELNVEQKASLSQHKTRESKKAEAFKLFNEGKGPTSPEVKALGMRKSTRFKYYNLWQNHTV